MARATVIAGMLAGVLAGCQSVGDEPFGTRPLSVRDLAKTDVDSVAEVHRRDVMRDLRALMLELYARNPGAWQRTDKPSATFVVERVFRGPRVPDFPSLEGNRGTASIELAFDPDFEGDRILAYVGGLASMMQAAYAHKTEFFITDRLDPQSIYNSARNVEIAAWRLRHERDPTGRRYISIAPAENDDNRLHLERLFGKVIARQDTLAELLAGRQNRAIRGVVQRVAGAVFLPI